MTFRKLIAWAAVVGVLSTPIGSLPYVARLAAQTTVTSTTLSAAVAVRDTSFSVASATGWAVGNLAFVDREAMLVTAVSSTLMTVQRGVNGTTSATHASGAVIYTGVPANFYQSDVSGTCTSTSEVALPHINVLSGNVFQCSNSTWLRYSLGGFPAFNPALAGYPAGSVTYTVNGAITIQPGVQLIGSSGALAMTLADPSAAQNGMIMELIASTAQAHTVTYTAGFGGGTTARDVATFGGAVNDNLVIIAIAGVWWVVSTRNVTLG